MYGVSKRDLQLPNIMCIYLEDMCSGLNCHSVAKHTEFYLGQFWFNVTFAGNVGCFEKSFTTSKYYMHLFRGHVQWFELS
jgi:hypothetical protein